MDAHMMELVAPSAPTVSSKASIQFMLKEACYILLTFFYTLVVHNLLSSASLRTQQDLNICSVAAHNHWHTLHAFCVHCRA